MSYSVTAFVIDLNELRSLIGCKDRKRLQDIKDWLRNQYEQREREELELDDDDEEAEIEPYEEPDHMWAIERLIMGEAESGDENHEYGYALRDICDDLGEHLMPDMLEGFRGREYLEEIRCILPLVRRGSPIPLPKIDDFPEIGYLTREECAAFEATDPDHPDEEVQEGREEFYDWVEAARSANKDLIGFYH